MNVISRLSEIERRLSEKGKRDERLVWSFKTDAEADEFRKRRAAQDPNAPPVKCIIGIGEDEW